MWTCSVTSGGIPEVRARGVRDSGARLAPPNLVLEAGASVRTDVTCGEVVRRAVRSGARSVRSSGVCPPGERTGRTVALLRRVPARWIVHAVRACPRPVTGPARDTSDCGGYARLYAAARGVGFAKCGVGPGRYFVGLRPVTPRWTSSARFGFSSACLTPQVWKPF